jgi:hypothetical protein
MKREYIIAYDIVSPGIWAVMAESEEEAERLFLEVPFKDLKSNCEESVAGVENIDISLGESE